MNQAEQVKIQYAKVDKLANRINFQQVYSTNSQSFYSWIFEHYNFPHKARILEVGCGTGSFWQEQRKNLPENCHFL